jgi:hypothetical protein
MRDRETGHASRETDVAAILYTPSTSYTTRSDEREFAMLEQLTAAGFKPKMNRDLINRWTASPPDDNTEISAATLESLIEKATVALLTSGLRRQAGGA